MKTINELLKNMKTINEIANQNLVGQTLIFDNVKYIVLSVDFDYNPNGYATCVINILNTSTNKIIKLDDFAIDIDNCIKRLILDFFETETKTPNFLLHSYISKQCKYSYKLTTGKLICYSL